VEWGGTFKRGRRGLWRTKLSSGGCRFEIRKLAHIIKDFKSCKENETKGLRVHFVKVRIREFFRGSKKNLGEGILGFSLESVNGEKKD